MYLNPTKLASGAYCCPQSVPVDGFFDISDELTAILVENKGFVTIAVNGDVVTAVTPDAAALAEWEEAQANIHQPCEPYGPCNGHGYVVSACPDCKTPQMSNIPVNKVAQTDTCTATITTNWTASGDYYYQDIAVLGILATDNPIVDILTGPDNDANVQFVEEFSKVFRIITYDNSIQVFAKEKTNTAFQIQLKVVR